MFADIKTIKKLTLCTKEENPEFPKDAAWKLEELNMSIPAFDDEFASGCKKFLESQKSTLKILRHKFSEKLCNFIMHNIPDLELLHLRIKSDVNFCDELKANEKLRSLSLSSFHDDESLEKILHHYKNIQYLNIRPCGDEIFFSFYYGGLKPKNVELLNLTHLSFHEIVGSFLDGVKMPNLKFLEIDMDLIDIEEDYFYTIPFQAENLANVEKITINGIYKKNIIAIIEKCPKLMQLNYVCIDDYKSGSDDLIEDMEGYYEGYPTGLKSIFKRAPHLKIVGILKDKNMKKKVKGAFAKLNREVTIKNYDDVSDMMTDYWPLDMIGDFEHFSSKLNDIYIDDY
jgi:hypothetical protein